VREDAGIGVTEGFRESSATGRRDETVERGGDALSRPLSDRPVLIISEPAEQSHDHRAM